MTVQERIEIWTGELWETTHVYQILLDGVREVIGDVDVDSINQLWTELTDSGSGVDLTNYRFVEARKLLVNTTYVSPSWRANTNIDENDPGVYSLGGLTYVIPDGGTILAALYPTIKLSSTTVTNVPEGLMNLFVLRTAEKTIQHLMTRISQHVVETNTMPTAPSAPSAPSAAYVDASATAPGAVTISALPTSPVYTAPTLANRTTSPTIGTLDLTKKVDGATSLTAPTAPNDPVIAYADATAASAAATTVSSLGSAPSYTKPAFGGSLTLPSFPTLDLETLLDGSTGKSVPTAPIAPVIAYSDATAATASAVTVAALGTAPNYTKPTFGGSVSSITSAVPALLDLKTEDDDSTALSPPTIPSDPSLSSAGQATITVGSLGTPPAFTKPGSSLSFTEWDTQQTAEDPELMAEEIRKLTVELQDFQLTTEEERLEYAKETEIYRATVQAAIKNAEIALAEAQNELSATDAMAVQDYIQELALYDRELGQFEAHISSQVGQFNANLQRAITGLAEAQRLHLQQYNIDVQNELNEFNKELAAYAQDAQHKIEQARLTSQEALANMRASTDVSVQDEAKTLEALVTDYNQTLARYDKELAEYTTDTQAQLLEYEKAFEKAFEPWVEQQKEYMQQYSLDIQNELNEFNKEVVAYQTDATHKIEQARITAAEALADMRASTDVSVQIEAKTMEVLTADYELTLSLFERKIALYQAEVQAVIEQYVRDLDLSVRLLQVDITGDVGRYQAEIADARAAFEKDLSVFNAGVARNSETAAIGRSEAQQTAQNTTDVAVVNEAKTLDAAIATEQLILAKHAQDVESYASQVRTLLGQQERDATTRSEKLKMYAMDRDHVRRHYVESKITYETAYRRHRSINVQHVDF